mgnify:CR=1 FL=1
MLFSVVVHGLMASAAHAGAQGEGTEWEHDGATYYVSPSAELDKANANPKHKMALLFRAYLGQSSRWAIVGEAPRKMDYQIWCGPAMGAFNNWVKGTYLENYENRQAVDVAENIMEGAAYLYRVQGLKMQGVDLPLSWMQVVPTSKVGMTA